MTVCHNHHLLHPNEYFPPGQIDTFLRPADVISTFAGGHCQRGGAGGLITLEQLGLS